MARLSPHWMFPRPHRKLIRVPQTIAAFATVTTGKAWTGSPDVQMDFEDQLEAVGLKRPGEHTERDRGRGGSGGRTHAAMLYALGLYFYWKESESAEEEVHLTLAGQGLIDQEDALPILRRQVLSHQYPSAYSVATNIDRRFQLRPFILLLRLLRDPDLREYISDAEIAACVLPYGERHSAREALKIKRRIIAYRESGIRSLEKDFADEFLEGKAAGLERAIRASDGKLGAVANTAAQWLRYTGYARSAPGVDFGSEEKTVTAVNLNYLEQIDAAIEDWGSKPLETMHEANDKHGLFRAAAAYQRTYGRKPGGVKDQRRIRQLRVASERTRVTGQVTASLVHLYATEIVREVTWKLVDSVVNHTGLDRDLVEETLRELIKTPQDGISQFLDRYQQMAFASRDEAIAFEKATASVLKDVFKLEARQLGQTGRVPDVEVWNDEWLGIIDTKAYPSYTLESDHQLRMQASYLPRYVDDNDRPRLMFFMYIAGGFAPSFNPNLRKIMSATGLRGSGIGIVPWVNLISKYPESQLGQSDLLELWSLGREITAEDVAGILSKAAGRGEKGPIKSLRSDYVAVREGSDNALSAGQVFDESRDGAEGYAQERLIGG